MPTVPALPLHSLENRLFTLRSPLPGAGLLLDRFEGTEGVSEPFRFTLRLLSERAELDLKAFLGRPLGVDLATAGGAPRHFHGLVTSFRHLGTDGGFARYEAVLGPWTELLRHRVDCRLFQNRTLPEILQEVFQAYGPLARHRFELKEPEARPVTLCAQYRETDFQFVARLLEERGLHYFFRFEAGGHLMVVSDDSRAAQPMPLSARLAYNAVPGAAKEDTIDAWGAVEALASNAWTTRSYDFKNPREPLDAVARSAHPGRTLPPLERFEPAGAYGYPDLEAGERLARRRMEEVDRGASGFQGASNVRFLTCAHLFELLDHYLPGETVHDRTFFVTRVRHEGGNNHLREGRADYRNAFECIPALARYRPPLLTERPVVRGPQTAVVVGPEGEEIHCDAYGRIRVQFHWDRLGGHDEGSSCWVRVVFPWAGAGYGFVALPRVGQEVVVEFLDGNPDRPLVTGCVYNELRRPPWDLPANRTQSGLLTRSSPGGDASSANALRFEDRKGQEEVWLHAERDQRIEVERDERHEVGHDRAKEVGNDETTRIGRDRTETVGRDEAVQVGNDRTENVGGNEQVSIQGFQSLTVALAQSIAVGGAKSESVALASAEQVGGSRSLAVGVSYVAHIGKDRSESVGRNAREEAGADRSSKVGKTWRIEAGDRLEVTVGASSLVMEKDGTVTLAGKKVNIHAEGPLVLKGKDIENN